MNLAQFAGLNVLRYADPSDDFYFLKGHYVIAGAQVASVWLSEGKPQSRDEIIEQTMIEIQPFIDQTPFSSSVARRLFVAGFDWLVQHDIHADEPPDGSENGASGPLCATQGINTGA
jgi:hypothetical protein